MTITEIITEFEKMQHHPNPPAYVDEVCRFSKELAMHVKQLSAEWNHFKETGEHGGNE